MSIEEKIKVRETSNKQILHLLEYAIERYPQLRFGQLLMISMFPYLEDYQIGDVIWEDESVDALIRLKESTVIKK